MTYLVPFLLSFLVSAIVPALLVALALLPWRRLPEEPWAERARQLQPIRIGHGAWIIILPFTAVVARLWLYPSASMFAVLIGAVLGGALSSWPLDRAIFPSFGFRKWLAASAVLSVFRLGWLFLVLFFALAMPDRWSFAQLGWAAAFLAASSALSAGLIYRLMVALGAFRPASEHLTSLVKECAAAANVTVKAVWEIPTPAGYAAALVAQRTLIFSTTTAAEHDDEELRAICRHELAHLDEGPWLLALRVAQTPLSLLPCIFAPSCVASMGSAGVLPPLLLWLLFSRLFTRLSLHLEKRADAAARQDAESPAYARALERLHRSNLSPAVFAAKAARTHPDLYDRMIAAGVTPDYPRPAPPSGQHWMQISSQLLSAATMIGWMVAMK